MDYKPTNNLYEDTTETTNTFAKSQKHFARLQAIDYIYDKLYEYSASSYLPIFDRLNFQDLCLLFDIHNHSESDHQLQD